MTDFTEFTFPSKDGLHKCHASLWTPEGRPKAVVQIVHGVAEYAGRYDHFARYLAEHGFVVCGEDHLGHGKTVNDGKYGYFGKKDGWTLVTADVRRLRVLMGEKYPGVPYFLLGHSMGSFLALAFVSSQFIQYFNYTKLGTIIALNGANFLDSIDIGLIPLMVIFVLFSAFMNLFMGSASAKWNILAPVFVPMFMLLNFSPELSQLAYRIGDSCTNVITPLMTYFAVIVVFAQRYDKKAGIGTITATMLPYSIAFLIFWTILLIIWLAISQATGGFPPIGIDTGLFYPAV